MKHLKKLAALLLVGVLALSLLTACGGGGGSTSADTQAETAVMAAINQNRPVNSAKLQNSSELRKIANQDLDATIKLGNLSSSFTVKSHTDLKNGSVVFTFIAKCDYKNTDLAKLIKTDTNINSHHMDKWSEVGVVVRTDKNNGQTYIAISVAINTSKT